MADKTLTIVSNGSSTTKTFNRDRFASVRAMTVTGSPLDQFTTSIQVTVAGHSDLDGIYTGSGEAQWTQQGGNGRIATQGYNTEDENFKYQLWFIYDNNDLDPNGETQNLFNWSSVGEPSPFPWAHLPSSHNVTIKPAPETITVDRTAPVITSDRVGESRPLLSKVVGGASAAYSLRDLNDKQGNNKVVRVRRESDNHERDFLAKEVSNGTLESFVNSQVTAPLDIRALTATGRDGDFLIAKAAYSLRSLGTRQATVAATGDTVARANGKYVCQVRRDSDDALKSFTADEITDGTLLSFVGTSGSDNGFVKTWYDQSVDAAGNTHGNHATQSTASKQPKIVNASTLLNELDFDGTDDILETSESSTFSQPVSLFHVFNSSASVVSDYQLNAGGSSMLTGGDGSIYYFAGSLFDSTINFPTSGDTLHSVLFNGASSTIHADGVLEASGNAGSGTFSKTFGIGGRTNDSQFSDMSFKEIIIYDTDQSDNRTAIEANIGEHYSISGIPAFDNSVNGFVETWYDQSGNGNDLSQPTASKQPTIVTSGVLNTRNNKPIVKFIQANSTHLTGASSILPTGTDIAMTIFQAMHVDASSGNRIGLFGHNGGGNDPATNKYLTGNTGNRRSILKTKDASNTVVTTQPSTSVVTNDTDTIITYFNSLSDGTQTHAVFNLGTQVQSTFTASITDQSYESGNTTILGSRTISDNFTDSEIFEVIVYDSDQLANRPAIEANLSNQYGIALS